MSEQTLRKWLDAAGFDWANGRIVLHADEDGKPCTGSYSHPQTVGFIDRDHPVLDQAFDSGYGSPECPSIVARDGRAMYFPSQYDGSTSLERVETNLDYYLDPNHQTPYPGGS